MKSIKKQILFSILIVLSLSTLIMAGVIYYELKEEMDETFDENIKQLCLAIAVHDFPAQPVFQPVDKGRSHLKGEEEFLIQVWQGDRLAYSSLPALVLPRQDAGGVHTIVFNGQKWRFYAVAQDDWLIQVSQPIPVRHSVIWEIYFELLLPILLQLPIVIGLVWFFVGRGFVPLKQISTSIEQRSSAFLDQLPEDGVPQEISSLVRALNDLLERLGTALRTQRRFTADAAHELRTPLTALTLQLDNLRRAKTEQDKKDAIAELYKGVERSTHLVRQLLELARQEPDAAIRMQPEPCDLQEILQEVTARHRALAEDRNIALQITACDNASITGDRNALAVMAGNLLNNAISYTQNGGRVDVSLSHVPEGLVLSVTDNGPGIPMEERARIFDRFYRIVGTNTIGSGLGLSIVKAIAEQHGAHVSVDDGPEGRGTVFSVIFPG